MNELIWILAVLGGLGVLMVGVAIFCIVYHVLKDEDEV